MKRLALSSPSRRWWLFHLPFESAESSVPTYRDSEEMNEFSALARFSIKEGMRENLWNGSQCHLGCTYEKEGPVRVPELITKLAL